MYSQFLEVPTASAISASGNRIMFYNTDVGNGATGQIPNNAEISGYRAVWNPGAGITYGSNVEIVGFKTVLNKVDGTTTYNIYQGGDAPNVLTSYTDVKAYDVGNPLVSNGARLNPSGQQQFGLIDNTPAVANFSIQRENTTNTAINTNSRFITFRDNVGTKGTIGFNTSGGVAYNETSDYRLKENIVDIPSAIDVIKQVRPVNFNFKTCPGKTIGGFIAHEMQQVIPSAVTGEKDAIEEYGDLINAEGLVDQDVVKPEVIPANSSFESKGTRIDPQQMDQTRLIPYLTKALQETIAKNEELEARLAALEGA